MCRRVVDPSTPVTSCKHIHKIRLRCIAYSIRTSLHRGSRQQFYNPQLLLLNSKPRYSRQRELSASLRTATKSTALE